MRLLLFHCHDDFKESSSSLSSLLLFFLLSQQQLQEQQQQQQQQQQQKRWNVHRQKKCRNDTTTRYYQRRLVVSTIPMIMMILVLSILFPLSNGYSTSNPLKLHHERITYKPIAGYNPLTLVTDYNAIDYDINEMEQLFSQELTEQAMAIYKYGGNSRSYADLTVTVPTSQDKVQGIQVNTLVYGMNYNRTMETTGKTMYHIKKLSSSSIKENTTTTFTMSVMYDVIDDPIHYVDCRVGAKVNPILDGCFASEGNITLGNDDNMDEKVEDDTTNSSLTVLSYTYEPYKDNKNDRSLQTFSTKASSKMKACNRCDYYQYFQKFYQYYGRANYVDEYIMAAIEGKKVAFDNTLVDFTEIDYPGRTAAVLTATVSMSVTMVILRELENVVGSCHNCPPTGCESTLLKGVDSAWAMYTGSMEGPEGTGSGKMMYSIADRECEFFHTCDPTLKTVATANVRMREAFQTLQQNVTDRACAPVRNLKDYIAQLLYLPLVQGTLRYAYLRDKRVPTDTEIAVGATLAASVVPVVAACSYHDASIIMTNMALSSPSVDFMEVRTAFQKHFDCLGISCKDVGGLWDSDKRRYYDDFRPCTFDEPVVENKRSTDWALIVPLSFVALIVLILIVRAFSKSNTNNKKKTKTKNSRTTTNNPYDDDDDIDDDLSDLTGYPPRFV